MHTQVIILGAGPAGLLLSQLLHLRGIESVVLEARSRAYVEGRVRAGVLEAGTVETLIEAGVGDRLKLEGLIHHGIDLRFDRRQHIIDVHELTDGKCVTVYGQQEIVRDLIAARLEAGGAILFEAEAIAIENVDTARPGVRYTFEGAEHEITGDIVVGADGFHGLARQSMPADKLRVYEKVYPFAWLGILAEAPPASDVVVYARHDEGFALLSMRSPTVSRLYIQCEPDENIDEWSDDRIWEALETRLDDGNGFTLTRGPILQRGITPMRSFVAEPMRHGRLFLAGDSAHIVPPTGAKGMNMAIADVTLLARALEAFYGQKGEELIDAYSATALDRCWKVQRFSWWVTSMTHRFPGEDEFENRMQLAQLRYLTASRAAAQTFAENYTGLALQG